MDPVTAAIIAALSAGVTSGATDLAKKAIMDGYEGLKGLLKKKFGSDSEAAEAVEKLQANPKSDGRQKTLAEELTAVNASQDPELVRAAQSILELIKALPQGEQHIQIALGSNIAIADRGGRAQVFGSPGKKDNDKR